MRNFESIFFSQEGKVPVVQHESDLMQSVKWKEEDKHERREKLRESNLVLRGILARIIRAQF